MRDQPTVPDLADELPYGDERSRAYSAARGRRCQHLLFVPSQGEHDRFLPVSDIRLMEVR